MINRDFSLISPSARWMILWKGHTAIPFAREVAELLEYPKQYIPDFKKRDFTFWASAFGLERRYRSINQLLNNLPVKNILELSSGYSFRCLEYALQKDVHYIDTDLPEIIATKKKFLNSLIVDKTLLKGKTELLPLNALDHDAFFEIVNRFAPGEIAIVNEGLLGYLQKNEKEKLCSVIHEILKLHGGCWITADIGLKNKNEKLGLKFSDEINDFTVKHQTEKNSFETYKEAEQFFYSMGFVIEKEARVKLTEISVFTYMLKSMTLRHLFNLRKKGGQIMTTWQLKAV